MATSSEFKNNFGNFISECRETALIELSSNEKYIEFKNKRTELYEKLISIIGPEAQEIFDEYIETENGIDATECTMLLFHGLKTMSDIQKCLNSSLPEYHEFLNEYL